MKNIKNFDNFINEELHPDTYKSAAEKLKEKGHRKRSTALTDYSKGLRNKLEPIEIEIYGRKFTLNSDSMNLIEDGSNSGNIHLYIDFDPEYQKNLTSGSFDNIWSNISNKDKQDFVSEYSELNPDIPFSDEEKEIMKSSNNYDDLTSDHKEFFEEWADMNQTAINLYFQTDSKEQFVNRKFDKDGLIIPDRRTAIKLLKFVKNYASLVGGELEKEINKLGVNDFYHN